MQFEPVIGLEVHAELETRSKMFCACPVVDSTAAEPNTAVCPICTGMPGTLPVLNQKAVEYALRVALALSCQVNPVSIFARKNYFYPDLPKGYQISQYEQPLAVNGQLAIQTEEGEKLVRIRRVHLEEDTGKLTHHAGDQETYSLVDLNRAGVPLLEIVTEPDMHSATEVRQFAMALRSVLQYLKVNSGDMQKGVMRVEPNVSVRLAGSQILGTRTEIKNLNSFRALERSIDYEIKRQSEILEQGGSISQETLGWDETLEKTVMQRSKEEAHDYRYFPEPDLPPLVLDAGLVQSVRDNMPELPFARYQRFQDQYQLTAYEAGVLTVSSDVADYFEQVVHHSNEVSPKLAANWITGEMFNLLNQSGKAVTEIPITPSKLSELLGWIVRGGINQKSARDVLGKMFETGQSASLIISELGMHQISDIQSISVWVEQVLSQNPEQVELYKSGKETVLNWLFGQVMRAAGGKANPRLVRQELENRLKA